jgi:hypothetical protein
MGKARPTGQYANGMAGPGAWPETDEDFYTNRANDLTGIPASLDRSLATWQGNQASIFNGPHVWSGDASKSAAGSVDGATKAMQQHQQQLRDAIRWCTDAASHIVSAKDTVTTNVAVGQQEIHSIEKTAAKTNHNPDGAIRAVVERKYRENVDTINGLAVGLGGKPYVPESPVDKPINPHPNQPRGERGPQDQGPQFVRSDRAATPTHQAATPIPPNAPPAGVAPGLPQRQPGLINRQPPLSQVPVLRLVKVSRQSVRRAPPAQHGRIDPR